MNFMTLQRPTFEELERRRQLRNDLDSGPQRSTTLQRRESMLSRGLNAIMRRQSFMSPQNRPEKASNLRRHDSFFMHSAFKADDLEDENQNLHSISRPSRPNLSRAKSFKYPEKISQIPPAELTRLRSKSQARDLNSSGEDPVYTSGSSGSGKSLLSRPRPSGASSQSGPYFEDYGYGQAANWLNRERFFQPPPRNFPRPNNRPNPRDVSEPPPSGHKRRLPLPDIFYYGDRWQNEEMRKNGPVQSLETPEPPPGSDMTNNNNR